MPTHQESLLGGNLEEKESMNEQNQVTIPVHSGSPSGSKLAEFLQHHLVNSMKGISRTEKNIAVFSIITSIASVFVYPDSVWKLEGWTDAEKVWLMISTVGANITLNKFFIELGLTDAVELIYPHIEKIRLKAEGWHFLKKSFVGTLTPLAVVAFVILGKESFLSAISDDWAVVNNIFITPAVAVGYSALMYMSVAGVYDILTKLYRLTPYGRSDIDRVGLFVKANLNNRINNLETHFKASGDQLPQHARELLTMMDEFQKNHLSTTLPYEMLNKLLETDKLGAKHTYSRVTKIATPAIKAFWDVNSALTIAGYYGVIVDGLQKETPISEGGASVFATISASLFTILICIMGSNLIDSGVDIASTLTTAERRPYGISRLQSILPFAMSEHPKLAVSLLAGLITLCAGSFGTSLDLQNNVMEKDGLLSDLLNLSPIYSTIALIVITVISNAYGVPDIVEDICKSRVYKAKDISTDKLRLITSLKATVNGMSNEQAAVMMMEHISGVEGNPRNHANADEILRGLGSKREALYKHMTQKEETSASDSTQYAVLGVEPSTGPEQHQFNDLRIALSTQLIRKEEHAPGISTRCWQAASSCWNATSSFFGGLRRRTTVNEATLGSELMLRPTPSGGDQA